MKKLVESTFVTLDGVIDAPHVWGSQYWDDEHMGYGRRLLFDADSLLLGRETYEGFAAVWPTRPSDAYVDRINALPKHVASNTLTEASWNADVIAGDVASAVVALKQEPGGDILKFGTGELDRTLIEHGLIDELHLWVFPVVAGRGARLLDGLPLTHFALKDAIPFRSGIVVHVLAPRG